MGRGGREGLVVAGVTLTTAVERGRDGFGGGGIEEDTWIDGLEEARTLGTTREVLVVVSIDFIGSPVVDSVVLEEECCLAEPVRLDN